MSSLPLLAPPQIIKPTHTSATPHNNNNNNTAYTRPSTHLHTFPSLRLPSECSEGQRRRHHGDVRTHARAFGCFEKALGPLGLSPPSAAPRAAVSSLPSPPHPCLSQDSTPLDVHHRLFPSPFAALALPGRNTDCISSPPAPGFGAQTGILPLSPSSSLSGAGAVLGPALKKHCIGARCNRASTSHHTTTTHPSHCHPLTHTRRIYMTPLL